MDKTATQFYPCETAPSLCGGGTIIRQHCRQALGDFFRAFLKDDPRWISLTHPVKDDQSTCLTYLLGLEHSVGIDFLCSAGFLKRGHSKYPNAISVVKAEWDAFVVEEGLGDVLEPVNISLVSGKRYPFINLGSRKNFRHTPNYHRPTPAWLHAAKRNPRTLPNSNTSYTRCHPPQQTTAATKPGH